LTANTVAVYRNKSSPFEYIYAGGTVSLYYYTIIQL